MQVFFVKDLRCDRCVSSMATSPRISFGTNQTTTPNDHESRIAESRNMIKQWVFMGVLLHQTRSHSKSRFLVSLSLHFGQFVTLKASSRGLFGIAHGFAS